MNKILTGIFIGIILGYGWHYFATKEKMQSFKSQIVLYETHYQDYIESPEYKAINKCKTENFWKAECIAWELNNNNDTNANANAN